MSLIFIVKKPFMKTKLMLILVPFLLMSCSKEEEQEPILYGGDQVEISPATIEISADACWLEYKVEEKQHFLPHLATVYDFEYTEDWATKSLNYTNLKVWGNVTYSTDWNYPGTCSNPENSDEVILTDGEPFKQSATVQIPKNTTTKKRCFYLNFSEFCDWGFVRILQHEK